MKSETSTENLISDFSSNNKITTEEEERRSEELQKILLDIIPILNRGVEQLGIEVEQICSGDTAYEKKPICQVLIDIQKTLREYPRGMGYRSKSIPPNLNGKPKLIQFRSNMDQLVWENISKLTILKDFVEFTVQLQKLCVIGMSIRDSLNSFLNNKCESFIKGYESSLNGLNIHTLGTGIILHHHSYSSGQQQQQVVPQQDPSEYSDSEGNSVESSIISFNVTSMIHNNVKEEINNTSISALKKSQKQQPAVLSRAPKQVMESTRILVDNVVNRKCMYREEKASIYREMMNDRLNLLKEDPKKYKLQLLQQRRQKLATSAETEYDDSSNGISIKKGGSEHGSVSLSPQNSGASGSPSSDKENSPLMTSPQYLSTSPPKSPPKSPEFLGVAAKGKKSHLLGHARSFSADTHRELTPNSHQHISHNNLGVASPPISPRLEKILKSYKLVSASPSSSSSAVVTSAVSHQLLSAAVANIENANNSSTEFGEWEEVPEGKSEHILQCKGYKMDIGNSKCNQIYSGHELSVLYTDEDEYHYLDDFSALEHFNFLGVNKNQPDNPMCVSAAVLHESNELLCIIRTGDKDEKYRISLNGKKDLSGKDMIKMIKKSRFNQMSNFKLKEVKDVSFSKHLLNFEAKNIHKTFKFGVLYCREDQGHDENELYSNNETSEAFQEFLKVLGSRVTLQGWTKYRGGLDVKDNTTGTHSVYKKWRDFEIMYHVAPMIPCRAADEQSVERKRHLGNDIVLIIFKEGKNNKFDPSIIKSNFNHIFAVIQVDDSRQSPNTQHHNNVSDENQNEINSSSNNEEINIQTSNNNLKSNNNHVFYKVSIGCKEEVSDFGPAFPKSHIFKSNDNFTDFLLTKLINGERSTLKSPVFAQKIKRTRKEFLHSFISDFQDKSI
ncbi:hypothetical protein DICPUDRAFT_50351 [Dictyostelium purpureum]|uniref:Rap-GAP domain-containing protein n=1 Tax=Dictyostelium purpureum TaxID=5786 RepID=F0ZY22_DICPU|nr:uncharacterized protein DICPUDRAFT_50351 [Dictyostelium purpureum]EGC31151.1 hypothetical protein DICPUDRAFT_50351 [Dictyostelium purpureum]|eukprot:XP_003292317.1 hypothetical protein DICPUDRAFT_50351 [Dictyostelium purpureum]